MSVFILVHQEFPGLLDGCHLRSPVKDRLQPPRTSVHVIRDKKISHCKGRE